MNKVYDNGALMLGNIDDVIKEVEHEIKIDLDMVFADKENILKDLKELKEMGVSIVCIDYDRPMGDYGIDYWDDKDIIKEVKYGK